MTSLDTRRSNSNAKNVKHSGASGAAWSLRHLTLGFRSGRDLTVCEFEPRVGLHTDSAEPAWDALSPSL